MCKRTEEAKAALNGRLDAYKTRERLAQRLGVNSAHVYKLFASDKLSKTLDNAMSKNGWLPLLPTRVRLAIDCNRDTRQRFRAEARRKGMTGEAYLLYLMEVAP